jgi:prepilin peptidase CpaA
MRITFGTEAALAAYVFPLVMAGVSDYASLRIPNWLTGLFAALFLPAALLFGHAVDWVSHLEAGAAVLFAAFALFACRIVGGGDAKLLAATALWVGLGKLAPFLMLTALAGGGFALALMFVRSPIGQASLLTIFRRLPSLARPEGPIPYGIPIAIAGIMLAPSLFFIA